MKSSEEQQLWELLLGLEFLKEHESWLSVIGRCWSIIFLVVEVFYFL